MSVRLTLRPADGMLVRKPDGTQLADEGERVEVTPYFARLLADGDVVTGKALKKRKPA